MQLLQRHLPRKSQNILPRVEAAGTPFSQAKLKAAEKVLQTAGKRPARIKCIPVHGCPLMVYSGMPMLSLTFGAVRLLAGPSMILSRKNMPGSYSLELKRNEISREPGSMRIMGIPCGERPLLLLWPTWVCSFRTPGPW